MPVVLVVVIVIAWMIVLGPNLLRRRSEAGGIHSVSRFQRSLRTLERSSPPPTVTPAYRLRSMAGPGGSAPGSRYPEVSTIPVLTVVGADALPRPALAFLGEQSSAGPPADGEQLLPDVAADYRPAGQPPGGHSLRTTDGPGRHLVRKRRRDTLGILFVTFMATVLVGLLPGASVALALSAVPGAALAAYVALLVHLRRQAEERELKLRYLEPGATRGVGGPRSEELGAGRGRLPVYMSGRYAHPSNQAVAH